MAYESYEKIIRLSEYKYIKQEHIRDEDPAEDGVMDEAEEKSEPENSFDKYRIKPEDDRGMLADQDIFDE